MKAATDEYINEGLWLYFNKTLLQILAIDPFGWQILQQLPEGEKTRTLRTGVWEIQEEARRVDDRGHKGEQIFNESGICNTQQASLLPRGEDRHGRLLHLAAREVPFTKQSQ